MTKENSKLEALAMDLFERALDEDSGTRADWVSKQIGYDQSVKKRALELLSFDQGSGGIIQTGKALSDSDIDIPVPERIGAYKVVERIGAGGMGAVYRGERDTGDFEHDVAIKLIKPNALSESLIERFQRERQMLADFTHPNIARLYDGGTTTDGAPYFIMEFIDGSPITEWADNKNLDEAARLSLFKDACEAIRSAHQNLIIHRDITPNNVLVTHERVVKLIDFGIAKVLDEAGPSSSTSNSLASLSFTPGFAAPERSQGAAANTLSDIYSLGKLLNSLLADMPISEDIQAVIGKTTQDDPKNRYTSVDALIEDLENYELGYPVEARAGSNLYRIGKFISRQKLAVSLATLAVTGLIAGLITTSVLYKKAEAERKNADARFTETRELANFMMFDLFDKLVDLDGTTSLQELLASKSQAYLETLSQTPRSTSQLQFELAQGLHRLASISGGPNKNIGQPTTATSLYVQSMDEFDRLVADYGSDPNFMEAYLEAMDDYGFFAFMALDDGPLTSEVTERFDTVINALITQYPEKLDYRMRRVAMLGLRGENFGWLNEFDQGRSTLAQALDVAKQAIDKFGTNPDIQGRIAKIYKAYSELEHKAGLQELGDQQLAVDYADKGIALLQEIENNDSLSQERSNEENLFYLYYSQTVAYQAMPDYQKSAETANKALKLINRLINLNPDNFSYKRNKYYLENALAQTYAVLGNNQQAQNMFNTAIASVSEALEGDADSPMILTDYGTIIGESAMAFELTGNHVKACDLANKSLAVFRQLTERQQINAYHQEVIIPKIKATQTAICK